MRSKLLRLIFLVSILFSPTIYAGDKPASLCVPLENILSQINQLDDEIVRNRQLLMVLNSIDQSSDQVLTDVGRERLEVEKKKQNRLNKKRQGLIYRKQFIEKFCNND